MPASRTFLTNRHVRHTRPSAASVPRSERVIALFSLLLIDTAAALVLASSADAQPASATAQPAAPEISVAPLTPPAPAAGMREAIVAGGLSSGKTYQVAQRCGAELSALKAYRMRFDADALAGRDTLYPQMGIDIDAVFKQGQRDGDAFYASLTSSTQREQVCAQTLALVKSGSRGG